MLTDFPVHATVAAIDLERARRWYEDKLGLTPEREDPGGVWYRFAGETWLYLYATASAGTARNTIAGWTVQGIETVMADLRARGVVFEDYDLGEIRTVDGLADFGLAKVAWFKDSEGNIYELSEVLGTP
jgi:catechol 2,3-dioxygenase-like lactoylglutathione lyase family enzyme